MIDLQRYAKAYAWVANAFTDPQHPSVQLSVLEAVAPFAFFHRLEPNETRLKENGGSGAIGAEFKYGSSVVARASQGYASVRDVLVSDFPEIMEGDKEFGGSRLQAAANGDLVLQTQFAPYGFEYIFNAARNHDIDMHFALEDAQRSNGRFIDYWVI